MYASGPDAGKARVGLDGRYRMPYRNAVLRRRVPVDRHALLVELERIVGKNGLVIAPAELAVYGYDGSIDRGIPDIVVLPTSTEQVVAVVKLARKAGVPVVPRGAGTGLSGGSVPLAGGIVLGTARLRRILEINAEDRYAVVEPGVINLDISAAAAAHNLCYVPDPSSQTVSTVGGNIAENAGGPHCLLYGMTSNHVLGLECVLPDGAVVQMGGVAPDGAEYDLRGVMVGSEGTLAIVTKAIVRLAPRPSDARTLLAVFDSLEDAGRAVSSIISHGIIPAALEIMDHLVMTAVEESIHAGYPLDAEAVLLTEVDGYSDGLDELAGSIEAICRACGARELRRASTVDERVALWKGRKSAFGAIGHIAPSYAVQDGVVPRSRLPEVLRYVVEVSRRHNLKIGNVFHAGDGNLHPLVMFDPRQPGVLDEVHAAAGEILRKCVELGGTITGEHGVGMEKEDFMAWLYNDGDLGKMRALKRIFDAQGNLNPGKIFPGEREHVTALLKAA